MLNEMIGAYCGECPVCGRYYHGPRNGWWCPLCGPSIDLQTLKKIENISNRVEIIEAFIKQIELEDLDEQQG